MIRWSYSYSLATLNESFYLCGSTEIGTKIWTVGTIETNRIFLFEFDTATETMKKHECSFDNDEFRLFLMAGDGDTLYIWMSKYNNPTSTTLTLFKVSTTSFESHKIVTIHVTEKPSNSIIIDNKIYLVVKNPECELVVIDLSTEEVTRKKMENLNERKRCEHFIMIHNEKLLIIEHDNSRRTVFRMENKSLVELTTDDPRRVINERYYCGGHLSFHNGMMIKQFGNDSFLQAFNFVTNGWNKSIIQNYRLTNNREVSVGWFHEVDGKLYTISDSAMWSDNFEIYVLEHKPSLSTICLINLADELVEADLIKIEEVKNQLPIPSRMKLVKMLNWRKIEWEKKCVRRAEVKVFNRVKKMIRKMKDQNKIASKAAKRIYEDIRYVYENSSTDNSDEESLISDDLDGEEEEEVTN